MASEHKCDRCRRALVLRETPDALAKWCGKWWDHPPTPPGECAMGTASVLEPSAALLAQEAELMAEQKKIRERTPHDDHT